VIIGRSVDSPIGICATIVDVGQRGDESWTVLADPEGNEFCVVRPKADLIGSAVLDYM